MENVELEAVQKLVSLVDLAKMRNFKTKKVCLRRTASIQPASLFPQIRAVDHGGQSQPAVHREQRELRTFVVRLIG